MSEIFTSAEGRIVQGDPYKPQPLTDDDNKPRLDALGKPKMAIFIALAFPKNNPEAMAFVGKLEAEARSAWPQYFDATGNCTNPSFSSKIIDGDGKDKKGRLLSEKDGFAGCKVVKFTRNIPPFDVPAVLEYDGAMKAWKATSRVKRGDYVKVTCDTSSNAPSKTDGMYMNLGNMIAFYREGDAIVGSGPSADEAFVPPPENGAQPQQPASTGTPPIGVGAGSPPANTGTTTPPPPHSSFMAPPPPTAEKVAPQMGPNANGISYEQYKSAGWSDEQMLAKGIILDGVPY